MDGPSCGGSLSTPVLSVPGYFTGGLHFTGELAAKRSLLIGCLKAVSMASSCGNSKTERKPRGFLIWVCLPLFLHILSHFRAYPTSSPMTRPLEGWLLSIFCIEASSISLTVGLGKRTIGLASAAGASAGASPRLDSDATNTNMSSQEQGPRTSGKRSRRC